MSNLDLATVELVSTLREAPHNGSPSSQDYNDSWKESLADLASLSGFVNDIIIPILNGLDSTIRPNPNGTPSGLEGRFLFGDTTDQTSLFFDNLSSLPLTIADSLRLLRGFVATVQTIVTNLSVQVTSLQTQLSTTNQNDVAQALQNFSASLQTLSAQVTADTNAISQLTEFRGKQQQARVTTGDVFFSYPATVEVEFPTAYADDSYTFSLTLEDTSGFLSISQIQKVTVGDGVSAMVSNSDSGGPHTGILHLIAYHD